MARRERPARGLLISRRALIASVCATSICAGRSVLAALPLKSPRSRARPFSEIIHGMRIDDPYRWMEKASDPAWPAALAEQSRYSHDFLGHLPRRRLFVERIAALSSGDTPSEQVQAGGGRIFTFRRSRGSATMNLFVRDDLAGDDRLLVDAATLGPPTSAIGIDYFWLASPNGKHVLFATLENGSEELTMRVVDVDSGTLLPDRIDRVDMVDRSWAPDGTGFFYNRLSPGTGAKKYERTSIWFHRLGTAPTADLLVLQAGQPGVEAKDSEAPVVHAAAGSNYVLGSFLGVGNTIEWLYVARLEDAIAGRPSWKRFGGKAEGILSATLWRDQVYAVVTDRTERGRLVTIPAADPVMASAREVVPEIEDFMTYASAARDALYVETKHVGVNGVLRVSPGGDWQKVDLPFVGADPFGLYTNASEDGAWLTLQSWVRPPVICHVDGQGPTRTWQAPGGLGPASNAYEFSVETVRARDGVKVPLTLIRKKGARRDGSIPLIMTAYGAYGAEIPTRYTPGDMAWLDAGGALAIAHVRGGGELGERWHKAAFKKTKANSWHDLVDCAKWLIAERWTSPGRLVIQGKSAGGITVGRAMTETPQLFAAAIMRVPAVNTTRLHLSPAGPANFPEFGDPADAEEFRNLVEMDAYLHLRNRSSYPPVLLTAAMNDARIPVWVPAKMAARLQDVSSNPAILRVETKGGHGVGATRDQENAERADIFAFAWWATHRSRGSASPK